MNQVEIQIVRLEILQRLRKTFGDIGLVGVPPAVDMKLVRNMRFITSHDLTHTLLVMKISFLGIPEALIASPTSFSSRTTTLA